MMFLVTNQTYSCSNNNKEPPTMRQDTVQTKYKKMAPPYNEIPNEDVDSGVKIMSFRE